MKIFQESLVISQPLDIYYPMSESRTYPAGCVFSPPHRSPDSSIHQISLCLPTKGIKISILQIAPMARSSTTSSLQWLIRSHPTVTMALLIPAISGEAVPALFSFSSSQNCAAFNNNELIACITMRFSYSETTLQNARRSCSSSARMSLRDTANKLARSLKSTARSAGDTLGSLSSQTEKGKRGTEFGGKPRGDRRLDWRERGRSRWEAEPRIYRCRKRGNGGPEARREGD